MPWAPKAAKREDALETALECGPGLPRPRGKSLSPGKLNSPSPRPPWAQALPLAQPFSAVVAGPTAYVRASPADTGYTCATGLPSNDGTD